MTAFIDSYLGKFISRKLFALGLGIGLEFAGHLSDPVFYLLVSYVGTQGVIDIVKAVRRGG